MIKILVVGDFCPIGKTEELSLKGNHTKIFNDILPILKTNDLNIANLECPLIHNGKPIKKTGPNLRADPKTVKTLKFGNFNLVTLANNHIMDQGEEGLKSTIEICNENNISYVGAGLSLDQARTPFIKNIKGKKIAVLNFAENEFANTHGNYSGANPISLAANFIDIKKTKALADITIVIVHGGNEMYNLPSPRFKETLRFYAEAGANCVIAHHSHCYSGHEVFNGTPIFYGIGNFLFDHNKRDNELWTIGIAVQLIIDKYNIAFKIFPFTQNRKNNDGVNLLNFKEKHAFENKMSKLNEIIQDDNRLREEFLNFIDSKRKLYSHYLEPYSNKVLHKLFRLRILPSVLSKKKKRLYLNLIRCESHRDVILQILKEDR